MRVIKFRGKDIETGKWVFGFFMRVQNDDGSYDCHIQNDTTRHIANVTQTFFKVVPESVGQFIGLHDKKKKELYDGDIIEQFSEILKVFYNECMGSYDVQYIGGDCDRLIYKDGQCEHDFEIIGNVFDNPELFK